MLLLGTLLVIAIGAAAVYGLVWLGEVVKKRNQVKQREAEVAERTDEAKVTGAYGQLEPFLQVVYNRVHPDAAWKLTYDEWVTRMARLLATKGLAWTDMLRPADRSWELSDRLNVLHTYSRDEGVLSFEYDYTVFLDDLYAWRQKRLPSRKQRQRGWRDVREFIAAYAFFAKTRVCMRVNLPSIEQVRRANNDA